MADFPPSRLGTFLPAHTHDINIYYSEKKAVWQMIHRYISYYNNRRVP
jgi:hypothetical protein